MLERRGQGPRSKGFKSSFTYFYSVNPHEGCGLFGLFVCVYVCVWVVNVRRCNSRSEKGKSKKLFQTQFDVRKLQACGRPRRGGLYYLFIRLFYVLFIGFQ